MKFWKIFVSLILIVAIVLTSFLLITKGHLEEKDGVMQNSRIYMKDVRYEDGQIFYTVVNKTHQERIFSAVPHVQYRNGEQWEFVILVSGIAENVDLAGAFNEVERCFEVEFPEKLIPGEYRLIMGNISLRPYDENDYSKGAYHHIDGTGQYIVGYFSIP